MYLLRPTGRLDQAIDTLALYPKHLHPFRARKRCLVHRKPKTKTQKRSVPFFSTNPPRPTGIRKSDFGSTELEEQIRSCRGAASYTWSACWNWDGISRFHLHTCGNLRPEYFPGSSSKTPKTERLTLSKLDFYFLARIKIRSQNVFRTFQKRFLEIPNARYKIT